jgi:general secretion pathway protein G
MKGDSLEETDMQTKLRRLAVARAASRGVTLIEVMIVVLILSLIATGVTVAVMPKYKEAQIKTAINNALEVRSAANRWRATRGGDQCPTISQLVQDKEIDSASKTDDPWSSAYKITCTEDEVTVFSPGPDKREGTADDIAVPKGSATAGH